MPFRILLKVGHLAVILLLVFGAPSRGQEHEPDSHGSVAEHGDTEHEFHRNHFGGLVGVSTHQDSGESGTTLGLEYARQFSPKWAVGAYLELVSSKLERDLIVAAGGIFYPIRGLSFILAPGFESVEKEVLVHGIVETESELELMIRVSVAYTFELTPEAGIGPILAIDWTDHRWTSLIAIGIAVGF
jgi:hypothetical protein